MERQQTSEDAVMTRIGQAAMLLHGGDREEARNRLGALWAEIGESGPPLHRCTLAHYMADTQDDPGDELAWDLRALTAAEGLGADADGEREEGGERGEGGEREEGGERGKGDAAVVGEGTGRDGAGVSSAVRAFYPALHLNLAADYAKLQRPEAARLHLDRARDAADALGDAGYGHGVRAGIARLERALRARGQ
ncbi:hypothetical protein ACFY7Z_30280 [Streptomyces sp. NPDC012623]|uniref:hypothetical protein n=1 Tax=unclassified Streptomyces TaxID=2593676 RepID=UPI0036AC52D6